MLMMFEHFSKYKGHLAMLVKNSVIKNLLQFLPSSDYKISNMLALKINAKQCFNASVEASLFKCSFIPNKLSTTCKVSSLLSPSTIESEFGWVGNKFVSNEVLYEQNKKYDGVSPFTWRQGIKHDCSKVMELQLLHTGKFLNGFKKEIDVETDLIFSLAKSSDLNTSVVSKLRKHIIITQKSRGRYDLFII
jgi:hypothetical protein